MTDLLIEYILQTEYSWYEILAATYITRTMYFYVCVFFKSVPGP